MAITKLVLWEILCFKEGPSHHLCREGMHFPFPLLRQANIDILKPRMREMQESELWWHSPGTTHMKWGHGESNTNI